MMLIGGMDPADGKSIVEGVPEGAFAGRSAVPRGAIGGMGDVAAVVVCAPLAEFHVSM